MEKGKSEGRRHAGTVFPDFQIKVCVVRARVHIPH